MHVGYRYINTKWLSFEFPLAVSVSMFFSLLTFHLLQSKINHVTGKSLAKEMSVEKQFVYVC